MNLLFLFVVLSYLLYSFLKTRKTEDVIINKKNKEIKKDDYYEKAIIAVIASLMNDKKYRIKRIILKPVINERSSLWKITGRGENHQKKG